MRIRAADRDDLEDISHLAVAASWDTLGTVLQPDSVRAYVRDAFSPAALKRSLLRGGILVADDEGDLTGFVEFRLADDHVHVERIASSRIHRHLGVGTRLLEAIQRLHDGLPISTDVLLGDDEWERFHERLGFVPGETVESEVHGQAVVRRRWWLAMPENAGTG